MERFACNNFLVKLRAKGLMLGSVRVRYSDRLCKVEVSFMKVAQFKLRGDEALREAMSALE